VDDHERKDVLDDLGTVLEVRGDWAGAEGVYRRLIEVAEGLGDTAALASGHVSVCGPLMNHGRYAAAISELDIAEQLFAQAGDRAGQALVTHVRGRIANQTGDPEAAKVHFQKSLDVRTSLNDTRGMAMTLNNLAVSAGHQGDYALARTLFERTLALRTEIGDLRYMGMTHNNLGVAAYFQQDYERAIPHLEEAVRLSTEIDCPLTAATARQSLGNCLRELGQLEAAQAHYGDALDAYAVAGDQLELCGLFEDVAMLAMATRPSDALRLLGAADALRRAIGALPMEQEAAQLAGFVRDGQERLGSKADDQLAAGRGIGVDGAVALCRTMCGAGS
jgi:tetratricopeptide (TPR) repeat protein